MEEVVDRDPSREDRRVGGGPAEVVEPGGDRARASGPWGGSRRGRPSSTCAIRQASLAPSAGRSAATGGRVIDSRVVPSGEAQSRLASVGTGNRPESRAHVEGEPEAEPAGDLRELRVEPEPATGQGLDVPVVEVAAVGRRRPWRNCQAIEDQGRNGSSTSAIGPADHVGPPLGDRLAERPGPARARVRRRPRSPAPGRAG